MIGVAGGRCRLRLLAALRAGGAAPRPRVFVTECIDLPFVPRHWLPQMIEAAGGEALLAEPARPSHPTTWDAVSAADPELVVIAGAASMPRRPPDAPPTQSSSGSR
jgi:iron complex transport system substrate-binding protein